MQDIDENKTSSVDDILSKKLTLSDVDLDEVNELSDEILKTDDSIDDELQSNVIIDIDDLDAELRKEIDNQLSELKILEENKEKLGDSATLGEIIRDVVWEQFINQLGVVAGEEFIKENRGLKLDLRDEAHIQTPENFANGSIATHNYISKDQLEKNYDRYKNIPHNEFRKEFVNPGMDKTLKRAGDLNKEGIETVNDIYTGRQIPTKTKLENGKNNPKAAQREHVSSSEKLYESKPLQMAYNNEEFGDIVNDPENLQGYTTAERNNRKSNKSSNQMDDRDKNEHWKKANDKSEEFIKKKEKEGEERLIKEGRKTQIEEGFRIGGKALQTFIMVLLAEMVKKIIQQLIVWLRSAEKSLNSFLNSVKLAITKFIEGLKEQVLSATDMAITTIVTAIWGPIVSLIKKAWILLKQSTRTIKEAIEYLKKPENRAKSFEIIMLEVGRIVIVGLSAAGALILSEAIEKALATIPFLAISIPVIGSLASILGIFLGALISGIVGALALRIIDNASAQYQLAQLRVQEDVLYNKTAQTIAIAAEASSLKTGAHVNQTKEFFISSTFDMSEKRDKTVLNIKSAQNTLTETEKMVNNTKDSIEDILKNVEDDIEI